MMLCMTSTERNVMHKPLGIYCRVSAVGDREDEGTYHSPATQERKARERARTRDFGVVGPAFVDENVSGAVDPRERPAMRALLDAIERGELGGIIAMDLSRVTREPEHGAWLIRFLNEHDAVLVVPQAPEKIATATDRFHFALQLEVDALYRRQAGERLDIEKERATREGLPIGPVPVGYMRPTIGTTRDGRPIRGPLEKDPETAPVVAELFTRRAAGAGYEELARFLDASGVSSWRDRVEGRTTTWTRQAVSAILKRRLYATGRLEYAGHVSEHDAGTIIDIPLFEAAAAIARDRTPTRSERWVDSPWLLTGNRGKARCGNCGLALIPWTGSRRRRRDPKRGNMDWVEVTNPQRRYRCGNRACTNRVSVDARRLERHVLSTVRLMGNELRTRNDPPDLSALEDALDVAERRVAQVMADGAADDLGAMWAPEVRRRREARDAAAEALGKARAEADPATVDVTDLNATWDELTMNERREHLHSTYMLERVVVGGNTPDTWEVHLR
jgi:DNA invertase Pin-like site-specific DNA recombinase